MAQFWHTATSKNDQLCTSDLHAETLSLQLHLVAIALKRENLRASIKPDEPVAGLRALDRNLSSAAEGKEAHRQQVSVLAIVARCCQTHRQSPHLSSFASTAEVRALSSAGITRPHRSYNPLPTPRLAMTLPTMFGNTTSASPGPPTDPDHLPCMPCSLPRWIGTGACWSLPCPRGLPRSSGGSASTSQLSRPAQASLALRPARLLTHHTWALSRGSALAGFPARTLASYQVLPTTT